MMYAPVPSPATVGTGEENMHDFLQQIRAFPLLTAQQEQQLAKRCAAGDEEAICQLVQANLRLVVSVAREYGGRGVSLLDLIQEGCIGLLAAAKKYDYTKDCRFATYATLWIRQGITRYLENQSSIIRVPAYTADLLRKISSAQMALRQQNDAEPSIEQIGQYCGIEPEKVGKLLQLQPQTVSLDTPVGENDTMGVLMEDIHAPQPQQRLVRQALTQTLDKLLSMLTPRQAQVLRLHYGLDDGNGCSLEQIGARLGISKERARQIEKQAMERLKQLGADIGLEDFLE